MKFWDCFGTVQVEISGLFWESLDRVFRTVFGCSWTLQKALESRIWPYECEWHLGPTYFLKNLIIAPSVQVAWL